MMHDEAANPSDNLICADYRKKETKNANAQRRTSGIINAFRNRHEAKIASSVARNFKFSQ